ncbi:enolase C-terminal domain-like protein [Streptomyces sp. NPDC093594]|uniref:enolase C-terminal domain-like protein n=1 Tax=Streptomyces sp. NPDC093594 TaxID=3155305 RepID=UPI00344C0732
MPSNAGSTAHANTRGQRERISHAKASPPKLRSVRSRAVIDTLAVEARELRDEGGFGAMKLRLGDPDRRHDLAAVKAVREGVGTDISLMVDFNQALGHGDAVRRCHELDDQDLHRFEESMAYDDVEGYARLAGKARTPLQWGENHYGSRGLLTYLRGGSVPLRDGRPHAHRRRPGGSRSPVSPRAPVRACRATSTRRSPRTSCASPPTAQRLVRVDWAHLVLDDPCLPVQGTVAPSDRPGIGVSWDEEAVKKYLVAR